MEKKNLAILAVIFFIGLLFVGIASASQVYSPQLQQSYPIIPHALQANPTQQRIAELKRLIQQNKSEIARLEQTIENRETSKDVRVDARKQIKQLKKKNKEYSRELNKLEKKSKSSAEVQS